MPTARSRTRTPHTERPLPLDSQPNSPIPRQFGRGPRGRALAHLILMRPVVRTGAKTVIDWDELRERLCGDDDLVGVVVDLFVEECPGWLAAIVSAVAAADPERIRESAHSLKGAAGNLSAHDVAAAAARLEMMGRDGNLVGCTVACTELSAECDRLLGRLRQRQVA